MILRVEIKVDGKIMHVIERETDRESNNAASTIWDFISKVKATFSNFSAADFLYFK